MNPKSSIETTIKLLSMVKSVDLMWLVSEKDEHVRH